MADHSLELIFWDDPLFFIDTNCSFAVLGNRVLKVWYGIILPSLPVSILYCITAVFLLQLIFSFAIITDHILSKVKELIFTISICLSVIVPCSISCTVPFLTLLILHTRQKWFSLLHPSHIFPYAGDC